MRCLRICTFLALLLGLTVAFGQAAQPILPKKKVTPPKTASTAKNPQTAQKKANPANFNAQIKRVSFTQHQQIELARVQGKHTRGQDCRDDGNRQQAGGCAR